MRRRSMSVSTAMLGKTIDITLDPKEEKRLAKLRKEEVKELQKLAAKEAKLAEKMEKERAKQLQKMEKKLLRRSKELSPSTSLSNLDLGEELRKMPEEKELEFMFERLLTALNADEKKRKELNAMSSTSKWMFILQQRQHLKLEQEHGTFKFDGDTAPRYFVLQMQAQPNAELFQKLAIMLRTGGEQWYADFVQQRGLSLLLGVLLVETERMEEREREAAQATLRSKHVLSGGTDGATDGADASSASLLDAIIDCLKTIMNGRNGVDEVLRTPGSVNKIVLCLHGANTKTKLAVYEILAAVCQQGEEALDAVLDALKYYRYVYQEVGMMESIVQTLQYDKSLELKLMAMALLNTFCNTPDSLEKRLAVRNHLYRLGIDRVFSSLKFVADDALRLQFKLFKDDADADLREEAERHELIAVDISDAAAIVKHIDAAASKAQCEAVRQSLLSVLRYLLMMPVAPGSERAWQALQRVVGMVSEQRLAFALRDDLPQLDLESLLANIDVKIQADVLQRQLESIVAEHELEMQQMEARHKKKVERLKKNGGGGGAGGVGAATTVGAVGARGANDGVGAPLRRVKSFSSAQAGAASTSSQEVAVLRAQLEELRAENEDLKEANESLRERARRNLMLGGFNAAKEKAAASRGAASTSGATAPGGGAPAAPGMPAAPPGAGAAPPPPPAPPGAPPPPGGPPPPPGMLPRSRTTEAAQKLTKQPLPKAKMKILNLDKISGGQVSKSIFEKNALTNADKQRKVEFDYGRLEKLFSRKTIAKKAKTDAKPKRETVHILDSRRAQNIGIFLSTFPVKTAIEVRDAILQINQRVLTPETTPKLMENVPTMEEFDQIKAYVHGGGDKTLLGPAELFFWQIGDIKFMQERLNCIAFCLKVRAKCAQLNSDMAKVMAAARDIQQSRSFHLLLYIIRELANFINNGSSRVCLGFRLGTLFKLADVKDPLSGETLLSYLVDDVYKNWAECMRWTSDLASVHMAASVSLREVTNEFGALRGELATIDKTMKKLCDKKRGIPADERFHDIMPAWYADVKDSVEALRETNEQCNKEYEHVVELFAENPKIMQSEDLFGTLKRFVEEWEALVKAIEKKRAEERKVVDRAERRQRAFTISGGAAASLAKQAEAAAQIAALAAERNQRMLAFNPVRGPKQAAASAKRPGGADAKKAANVARTMQTSGDANRAAHSAPTTPIVQKRSSALAGAATGGVGSGAAPPIPTDPVASATATTTTTTTTTSTTSSAASDDDNARVSAITGKPMKSMDDVVGGLKNGSSFIKRREEREKKRSFIRPQPEVFVADLEYGESGQMVAIDVAKKERAPVLIQAKHAKDARAGDTAKVATLPQKVAGMTTGRVLEVIR